eukprot:5798308-Heterocapsa_arctica.AAC.1
MVGPPATDPPSCKGYGGQPGRTIDFFLVSRPLLHLVKSCSLVNEAATGRHRPVRLELRGQQYRPWVKVLMAPKQFPKEIPVGPSCQGPEWEPLVEAFTTAPPEDQAGLQDAYKQWAVMAEKELMGVFQIPQDDQERYFGRGLQPTTRWKKMSKTKGSAYPRTSAEGRDCRWVSDRLTDFIDMQTSNSPRTLGARKQLLVCMRKWRPHGWDEEGQPERTVLEQE